MTFYFLILFGFYFVLLLALRIGWSRAVVTKDKKPACKNFLVSVIIPVRNEGRNIRTLLHTLSNQTYPSIDFEVIMVNDHSSDNSLENCRGHLPNLTIHSLSESENGKKAALTHGINQAKGEIIATTDADCLLPDHWLASINSVFQDNGVAMAAGMVAMTDENKFFAQWQAMEFGSVIGTGVAMFGLNRPMMCNGANLSFRKEVFHEVNGYEGNEHIASGDDEFLMRKMVGRSPGSVEILNAIVITQPQESLKDFLYQRLRWASKWRGNPSWTAKLFAVFIFLIQVTWIYFMVTWMQLDYRVSLAVVIGKIATDLLFLLPVFRFMKIKFRFLPFLGLQFLYPFYVVLIGLSAPWTSYQWKDRKIL